MWALITRGRPARAQLCLDSYDRTGQREMGVVVADGTKEEGKGYIGTRLPPNWIFSHTGAHCELGECLNRAFNHRPIDPWYGFLTDGCVAVTPGWEAALIEAAGSWGIAYLNDQWKAGPIEEGHLAPVGRMAGPLVFGGELLRALGWWAPPGFVHLYIDDVWEMLARGLGNWRYLSDFHFRHPAPGNPNNRAAKDANHFRIFNGRPYAGADREAYERWRTDKAGDLIKRIKPLITMG